MFAADTRDRVSYWSRHGPLASSPANTLDKRLYKRLQGAPMKTRVEPWEIAGRLAPKYSAVLSLLGCCEQQHSPPPETVGVESTLHQMSTFSTQELPLMSRKTYPSCQLNYICICRVSTRAGAFLLHWCESVTEGGAGGLEPELFMRRQGGGPQMGV